MKFSLALVLVLLATVPAAQAVMDQEEDVIGAYFDPDAEEDCREDVAFNTQLPVYIVLTRPTFSDLYGFELGLDYGSELIMLGCEFANEQAMNVGSGDDFIVGFGSPTATREATLLMTLSLLFMGTAGTPVSFTVRGSQPSSLDPHYPTVLLEDSELLSTGLHSDNSPFPYFINGRCSFEDESRSWDGVKTLYRR